MAVNQGCLLWQLQELDKREGIVIIEKDLKTKASQIKAKQKDLTSMKETTMCIEDDIKTLVNKQEELKICINELDEQLEQNNEKLYNGKTTNVKELNSFQLVIQELTEKKNTIEEQLLKLMEETEEREKTLLGLKANMKSLYKKYKKELEIYKNRQMELELAKAEYEFKREEIVEKIDLNNINSYNVSQSSFNNFGIARITKGICSGCHIGVSKLHEKKIKSTEELQTCENCGRILVYC